MPELTEMKWANTTNGLLQDPFCWDHDQVLIMIRELIETENMYQVPGEWVWIVKADDTILKSSFSSFETPDEAKDDFIKYINRTYKNYTGPYQITDVMEGNVPEASFRELNNAKEYAKGASQQDLGNHYHIYNYPSPAPVYVYHNGWCYSFDSVE